MQDINAPDTYRNGFEIPTGQSVFRKKNEQINWKLLATVDIDKVIRENDINVLKDNLKYIAFSNIDSEFDSRNNDRNLLKMFKLAQLIIDYLLSSQDYLARSLNGVEDRCQMLIEETDNAKRKLQENESYINDLKRECHRRKKLILAQQQIMDSGPNTHHQCPYCEKAFLNSAYLQSHLERKHHDRYIKDIYLREKVMDSVPSKDEKRDVSHHDDSKYEKLYRLLLQQQQQVHDQNASGDNDIFNERLMKLEEAHDRERHVLIKENNDLRNQLQEAIERMERSRHFGSSNLGDLEDEVELAVSKKSPKRSTKTKGLETLNAEEARKLALEQRRKHHHPHQHQHHHQQQQQQSHKDDMSVHNEITTPSLQKHLREMPTQSVDIKTSSIMKPMDGKTSPQTMPTTSIALRPNPDSVTPKVSTQEKRPPIEDMNESDSDMSDGVLEKFRLEIIALLQDHLKLHGIDPKVTGIPRDLLEDKLEVIGRERKQMEHKYHDFDKTRRQLVKKIEKDAIYRINNPQSNKESNLKNVPQNQRVKLNDNFSNQSLSPVKATVPKTSFVKEKEYNDIDGTGSRKNSPSKGQLNNAQLSSDFSNTSAWTTESKVNPRSKQGPANKSSDFDDSDFSM